LQLFPAGRDEMDRSRGCGGTGPLLENRMNRVVLALQTAGRRRCFGALAALLIAGLVPAAAADRGFPFDTELMLEARPMKGSKRVPILEIGPTGATSIDLWCNTVQATFVVVNDTVTIVTGAKTDRQCPADRLRGDDDLIAALSQVTGWRRDGDVLTLRGPKTLRFRTSTH
jgi:heat shock protein HslJ